VIMAMRGFSTAQSNPRTDIRIAGEPGYDGLEIAESKLLRSPDNECTAKDLVPVFIERISLGERAALMIVCAVG
jgi:hypothetical protein